MQIKRVVSLAIVCAFSITTSSCKYERQSSFERIDNHYGYATSEYALDSIDGYSSFIAGKGTRGDINYITVNYYPSDDSDVLQKLFTISNQGIDEVATISWVNGSFANYQTCIGDYWVEVSYTNDVIFYGLQDGIEDHRITFENEPTIIAVEGCDDGIVLLEQGRIVKCDIEGNILAKCSNDDFYEYNPDCPFYEENGKSYIVVSENYTCWAYYEVNFDSESSLRIMSDRDISDNTVYYSGKYMIDNYGEYKVDAENLVYYTLADWNDIDVRPERKTLANSKTYLAFDDTHFSICYEYTDGSIDIVYLTYDASIDFSSAEKLTIGGYGLNDDLLLKWAIYIYNTSQNEYRAVLDDYSNEFGYSNSIEAQASKAALIQYLNSGGAPDIYYGYDFDYRALYNNGMTQDIYPYIVADDEFDINILSQAIRTIVLRNEQCTYLFAAYTLNGYVGLDEFFEENNNISISDLTAISQEESITPVSRIYMSDIVDYALRYSMWDFVNSVEDGQIVPVNQLIDLINFSSRYGLGRNEQINEYCFMTNLKQREYLLSLGFWGDFVTFAQDYAQLDEGLSYIGYPSLDGSAHTFNAAGQLAMSSSTNKADACWQFMKSLFSYDVQIIALANGYIPVNVDAMDELVQVVNNPDSDGLNDTIHSYVSCGMNGEEIPEGAIENYIRFVNSIDTPVTYDWGIYNMICDEMYAYESQGKSIEEVAESLLNRLDLYVAENY